MVAIALPSRTGVRVIHGPNDGTFDGLTGASVSAVREALADAFNLPWHALAFVNGERVGLRYLVRDEDRLEFVVPWGQKGSDASPAPEANRLFTVKEAAAQLHCSISFVYKLMQTGQIAYERRGRRKLPLAASVADYRIRNFSPALPRPLSAPGLPGQKPYQFKRLFTDRRPRRGN